MNAKLRGFGFVALVCLLPGTGRAVAQPLFHYEHDVTVDIGDYKFGIREVVQEPGDFRWTQVWFGPNSISVWMTARDLTLYMPSFPALLPGSLPILVATYRY